MRKYERIICTVDDITTMREELFVHTEFRFVGSIPWIDNTVVLVFERETEEIMTQYFRKKPIVVTATQWFPGTVIDGVEEFQTGDPIVEIAGHLKTLEHLGDTRGVVMPGDWVITGVNGEKYACKPDVFKQLYEPYAR